MNNNEILRKFYGPNVLELWNEMWERYPGEKGGVETIVDDLVFQPLAFKINDMEFSLQRYWRRGKPTSTGNDYVMVELATENLIFMDTFDDSILIFDCLDDSPHDWFSILKECEYVLGTTYLPEKLESK